MFHRLVLTFILLLSASASATTPKNQMNLDWFLSNYHSIERTILTEDKKAVIPILNTLGEIWYKRDGATSGEISPLLAQALITHTDIALSVLSDYPESFERWLAQLQGVLFTDIDGNQKDSLIALRSELITTLSEYSQIGDKRLVPYALRLLDRIKEINVRVVD
ncbi:hypothetical protein [Photobacterium sp. J15]|uniref:hypothetical protein n=1 Tax=Photobacterium sp. J15 TaxID=265901 RepID=UPI0007E496C9|nr:hypothetical protein [Photobacterium sp. J15]